MGPEGRFPVRETPSPLPDLTKQLYAISHLKELRVVMLHLLNDGLATKSGRYVVGKKKRPLFPGVVVEEVRMKGIDKKTGEKILNSDGNTHGIKDVSAVHLINWLVFAFDELSDWAGQEYGAQLDKAKNAIHIIIAAAKYIDRKEARNSK